MGQLIEHTEHIGAGAAPALNGKMELRRIRVAFVEDDAAFREAAANELGSHGFDVECFGDGDALLSYLTNDESIELIVLDWILPRVSGIELLPKLRQASVALPVIFFTGRSHPTYEKLALERGANDFVDKLRGIPILAQRLRLVANSTKATRNPATEANFHCGRLLMRWGVGRAFWDGMDVGLTMTEFKIVYLLASNVGNYVAYRAIYDSIHYVGFIAGTGEDGFRANVRSFIKRIRNKFREADAEFMEINNYQTFGYRWGPADK
jgi:two-component system response regulator ChvI